MHLEREAPGREQHAVRSSSVMDGQDEESLSEVNSEFLHNKEAENVEKQQDQISIVASNKNVYSTKSRTIYPHGQVREYLPVRPCTEDAVKEPVLSTARLTNLKNKHAKPTPTLIWRRHRRLKILQ